MTGLEAKLANVTAIEQYGMVMKSKGLHARAKWAQDEALRLRRALAVAAGVGQRKAA